MTWRQRVLMELRVERKVGHRIAVFCVVVFALAGQLLMQVDDRRPAAPPSAYIQV